MNDEDADNLLIFRLNTNHERIKNESPQYNYIAVYNIYRDAHALASEISSRNLNQ